jgi:hypothetical protein
MYVKGTVSQDFLLQVFFIFPQATDNNIRVISNFSIIRGDIRKSRGTTGINDTGGKFFHWYRCAAVVDTGGKFATGVNDNGGKSYGSYTCVRTMD